MGDGFGGVAKPSGSKLLLRVAPSKLCLGQDISTPPASLPRKPLT